MHCCSIFFIPLADFVALSHIPLQFNSSSTSGDQLCSDFEPINDMIIENTETFNFQVMALNSSDTIVNSSMFSLSIYDDDGKITRIICIYSRKHWIKSLTCRDRHFNILYFTQERSQTLCINYI